MRLLCRCRLLVDNHPEKRLRASFKMVGIRAAVMPIFYQRSTTTISVVMLHDGKENKEEEDGTEYEIVQSRSSRRSRAAAIHNWSKQRRRARINQKIKALQKLVPNANKTDKASTCANDEKHVNSITSNDDTSTPTIATTIAVASDVNASPDVNGIWRSNWYATASSTSILGHTNNDQSSLHGRSNRQFTIVRLPTPQFLTVIT
ncbi:hypothetical protein L1987_25687 [Smallanthus sonchifolius]|uniref:Uncharacterized protein n=1 Tax=Smallanthus sonchifolius TaxID=185202 RepID=A0ACB9I8F2_9ASTR|nr:hypothetical protein L1987_25687 [Smallanthus sonchifolius]